MLAKYLSTALFAVGAFGAVLYVELPLATFGPNALIQFNS